MSNLLTWKNSGVGVKTGTDSVAFINDFVTLFNSKSGDATYLWQVASSNSAATPYYLVLKRKDGSPGRILVVIWTSAPAGNNATILDQSPTTFTSFIAWFPNGNVDTPSNLAAASGTILGNDTGATKVASMHAITSMYASSFVPFYFETAESIFLATNPLSSTTGFVGGAGNILVDAQDNAYGGVYGSGNLNTSLFSNTAQIPWTSSKPAAGNSTNPCIRTNYGSTDRVYFQAWIPTGAWAAPASAGLDYLTDSAAGKAFLIPVQLIGQLKDSKALDLKLRQIAYGPFSGQAFATINITGPVTVATQFCATTTGGGGFPWFTNFKV